MFTMERELARQASEGAAIRAAMRTDGTLFTNNRVQLITSVADDCAESMSDGANGSALVTAIRAKKSLPVQTQRKDDADHMSAGADGSDFLAALRAKRAK